MTLLRRPVPAFRDTLARQFLCAFVAICALILLTPSAHAASSSLKIPGGGQLLVNAKSAYRDYDQGTLELKGNVQVFYNQQYMSCDHAIINEKTHVVEAEGNLVISSTQAYVEGDRAVINYVDNTGVIDHGFVKSGQVIFEGSLVRKTGPSTYEAENSYYTACTTCPTAWTFAGTRMSAEIGGYAYIKNPVMEIANVPVLWLPYLIVPLKSERQTGLLIPSIEFAGDDGIVLGLKFFWAINRSNDILFTMKNYSRRGIKLLGEYNYMLGEQSLGTLNFGIMPHDDVFSALPQFADNPVGPKGTRWFLTYDHRYELPGDFTQRSQLNLVSDLLYPRDFSLEMPGWGDPALENRISLTRNTEATHASIDVDYYVNMLKSNPIASNDDAVHRWPELRYSYAERPLNGSRLLAGFDVDYVNFARDGLGYDDVDPGAKPDASGAGARAKAIDTTRTLSGIGPDGVTRYRGGQFDPKYDLVRTGQRLDIKPEISYPFMVGHNLDILPSLQYRHTQYVFNITSPDQPYDTTPSRSYALARMSARSRFFRIFQSSSSDTEPDKTNPRSASLGGWVDEESRPSDAAEVTAPQVKAPPRPSVYRHEVMPELVATYLPYINQPQNHPFFNQSAQVPIFLQDQPISNDNFNSDQSSMQFDYNDQISVRTAVSFYMTNRLVRKRYTGTTPEYQQIASWRLGEAYDFNEASRQDSPRLPFSDVESILDVHLDQVDFNSVVQYFPYHNVTNSNSYVRFKPLLSTNFFQVGYVQNFNITRYVEQTTKNPDNLAFSAGFSAKYLDIAGSLNYEPQSYAPVDFKLNSWSTDLNLKPPGNCWGIKVHYEQLFGGPTAIHFDFDYNFGGDPG